ncbi:flavoprotein [Bacillus haikouensis]|uniref:flavoprotein n=1 Tax=Bacillus haikouensis TaxID=1510468 RepID=UPI001555AE5E|nr:flavoprotein [Bacillus haikouensis]NQD67368.1 flavoprotein [Bacillus haikouensis]
MNDHTFRQFLNRFIDAWKQSSLTNMEKFIANDYQAREITGEEIIDFGYEESINGWKQGFDFVLEVGAKWEINEISILSLRENEMLATLSATIIIPGKTMEKANLFYDTFKKSDDNEWKLIRSYIEAGVPIENL